MPRSHAHLWVALPLLSGCLTVVQPPTRTAAPSLASDSASAGRTHVVVNTSASSVAEAATRSQRVATSSAAPSPASRTEVVETTSAGTSPTSRSAHAPFTVRVVYLVPADRTPREDIRAALEANARGVQAYFRTEVGTTFALNEGAVVEIVRSARPAAAWFCEAPTAHSSNPDDRCYYNTLDELRAIYGVDQHQAFTWVVYADTPGDRGRGVSGVAVRQHNEALFASLQAGGTPFERGRWVGGIVERAAEPDGFVLADDGRGLRIWMPRAGGQAMNASGDGAWAPLYALAPPT